MKRLFFYILLAAAALTACKQEEKEGKFIEGDIAIALRVVNSDGMSGNQYLTMTTGLQGQTVDTKKSFPGGFGAEVFRYKNALYTLPNFMESDGALVRRYVVEGNKLKESGKMQIPSAAGASSIYFVSGEKAYLSLFNRGEIIAFNPTTMQQLKTINLAEWSIEKDNNPDPGAMVARDGKLYVGLAQVTTTFLPLLDSITAEVGIIDMKTDEPLPNKIVHVTPKADNVGGPSFATRPVNKHSIYMDSHGDIYVICIGGFGQMDKHQTGILRIKKGEDAFDPSYKWMLEGLDVSGDKISWVENSLPIADGEMLALINVPALAQGDPTGAQSIATKLFRLNLHNKTIKRVEGVPTTRSMAVGLDGTHDGKVLVGVAGEKVTGFYLYDPQTEEVSKGPVIKTEALPLGSFDFRR